MANNVNSKYKYIMNKTESASRAYHAFTQVARFVNRLMRERLSTGPITVQQCYALEALVDGKKTMNELAEDVALHQSTLTRVVEKLEKQNLVVRNRKPDNQRVVEVEITEEGQKLHEELYSQCLQSIGELLEGFPEEKREVSIESLELLASILNPKNSALQELICGCSTPIPDKGLK